MSKRRKHRRGGSGAQRSTLVKEARARELRIIEKRGPLRALRKSQVAAAMCLVIIVGAIYGYITLYMVLNPSDYSTHILYARELDQTGRLHVPHFLFHLLTAALYRSVTHSYEFAALYVAIGSYALTALVIYGLLIIAVGRHKVLGKASILFCAAFAVMLAQPIALPPTRTYPNLLYDLGYLWQTAYHNPTLPLTKPFSLLSFVGTSWCLTPQGRFKASRVALLALVTIAAVLSKPSYIICLLPAAGLMALSKLALRKQFSLGALTAGVLIPATLVLGWQYYRTYAGVESNSTYRNGIMWAPFLVIGHYSSYIAMKYLFSITFPVLVLALYWKSARRDTSLLLAWLSFLFASFYVYGVAEKMYALDGNFLWSGYAAAFVLFVASACFWFRELAGERVISWTTGRTVVCSTALLLHSASGAYWTWVYGTAFDWHIIRRL